MNPTPSPTPFIVQVISDGSTAPWLTPLLAGLFLIVGAFIAFMSTALSDRRKLRRDDLRQWDKEIRDTFLRIARAHQVLVVYPFMISEGSRPASADVKEARAALHEIASAASEMQLIAPVRVALAATDVSEKARRMVNAVDSSQGWANESTAMDKSLSVLLDSVKTALRLSQPARRRL